MVVVPTQEDVVIEFQDTWAESGGKILTFGGVASLLAIGFVTYRRRVTASEESGAS
jgi:hypothetical protein